MLLEYGVSNYRSFEKYAFIDLRPAKNKIVNRYPRNYVVLPTGEKVLKSAVIVGENAGGKTNFIESLTYLRYLMVQADATPRSAPNCINEKNLVRRENTPESDEEVFDSERSLSEQNFDVSIALSHATYFYELKISAEGVISEELSFQLKKGGRKKLVFLCECEKRTECAVCERNEVCDQKSDEPHDCRRWHITYNPDASDFDPKLIDALNGATDYSARLTLVRLATLGEPRCREVLEWFVRELIVVVGMNSTYLGLAKDSGELLRILKSDEYLEILKLIDRSICKFEVNADKPFDKSILVRRDDQGKESRREAEDDSTGVRQFLHWAFYIYEIVHNNKTVFADEIDSAMNPTLSDKVMAYINGMDHQGQIIFATHNIFNLSLRTYMKEQINFVTKDPDTLESSLYSLADFDDLRYDIKEELYEFYMRGILGGTVHV